MSDIFQPSGKGPKGEDEPLIPFKPMDIPHHDQPDRHYIGGSLLAPSSVSTIGPAITMSVGRSNAVAREDHVHGYASAFIMIPVAVGVVFGSIVSGVTVWFAMNGRRDKQLDTILQYLLQLMGN